ncbi:copper chaperone PCu(A)C [Pseudonocardia hispaniensis]|uniref:Copper chaperone PCu(A)C n=1 Tax=Pseudonocardia hispaniensis TaxID=904933 RepID=A0ABW1J297_9PSEU
MRATERAPAFLSTDFQEMTMSVIRTGLPHRLAAAVLTLGVAVGAAGCGSSPTAADTPAKRASASSLVLIDGWVKAADEGMTAAFGKLVNSSGRDVHIVSATSPVTRSMELHEMAHADGGQMVMREKKDGLVVSAGGEHRLEPGGDHLMFMELTGPVRPGQDVPITLTAEDGSSVEVTAVARSYTGANEDYQGGDHDHDHDGHGHGGH